MAIIIADQIVSIIVNLFSSWTYEKIQDIKDKKEIKKLSEESKLRIKQFIDKNEDNTILTDNAEHYLKYYHPISSMLNQLTEDGKQSDRELLQKLWLEFKNSCNCSFSILDEQVIKDFLLLLLGECKTYIRLNPQLCSAATYNRVSDIQEAVRDIQEKQERSLTIDQLSDFLKKGKITEVSQVRKIYDIFTQFLSEGCVDEIQSLVLLIDSCNEELLSAVKFMLGIVLNNLSDDEMLVLFNQVQDEYLKLRLSRYSILYFLFKPAYLQKVRESIADNDLFELCTMVIAGDWEKIVSLETPDGYPTFIKHVQLLNKETNEQWLINRMVFFYLMDIHINIGYECTLTLFGKEVSFWEKIFLYQLLEGDYESVNEKDERIKEALDFFEKGRSIDKFRINDNLCKAYYMGYLAAILMYHGHTASSANVLLDTFNSLPDHVKNLPEIQSYRIQGQVMKPGCNPLVIAEECQKTNIYWPMRNALNDASPQEVIEVIEEYKFLLKEDFNLLLLYIEALRSIDSSAVVIQDLLLKMEVVHSKQIKYWLLRDEYLNEGIIQEIYAKWTNSDLYLVQRCDGISLAYRLFADSLFEPAKDVLNKMKLMYGEGYDIDKLLIRIHIQEEKYSLALELLNEHFDKHKNDEFLVGMILECSISCNREVRPEIVAAAELLGTPSIKAILAILYARENKRDQALLAITQAIIGRPSAPSEWYRRFFSIHVHEESSSTPTINGVSENTVAFFSAEGKHKLYGVLADSIRQINESYKWDEVIFLSKIQAIRQKLYRKHTGDKVIIEDVEYIIDEILPLEVFLFRRAMDIMTQNGIAWQIHFDVNGEKKAQNFIEAIKPFMSEEKDALLEDYRLFKEGTLPMPLIQLAQRKGAQCGQFIQLLLKDDAYCVRDVFVGKGSKTISDKYIISFSSIVMLHEIGFPNSNLMKEDLVVPQSAKKLISLECEEIINSYSRERVARMGMINGEVFLHEADERERDLMIGQAIAIKDYSADLPDVENKFDQEVNGISCVDLKQLFGISDYDSIQIAASTGRTLVTGETMLSEIGMLEAASVQTLNIVDFIARCNVDVFTLFTCIMNMVRCKFVIFLTENVVKAISDAYQYTEGEAEREKIVSDWIDLLYYATDIKDELYKAIFVEVLDKVYASIFEQKIEIDPVIMFHFIKAMMKYHNVNIKDFIDC